jgi:hypothetical protein
MKHHTDNDKAGGVAPPHNCSTNANSRGAVMPNPLTSALESKRRRGYWSALWWVAVALFLYVLSTGPVLKLCRAGYLPYGVAQTIYYPLEVLAPEDTPQEAFLEWYVVKVWRASYN